MKDWKQINGPKLFLVWMPNLKFNLWTGHMHIIQMSQGVLFIAQA